VADDWYDAWVTAHLRAFGVRSGAAADSLLDCRDIVAGLGGTAGRLEEVTRRMLLSSEPAPRYPDKRWDRVKQLLAEVIRDERIAERQRADRERGLFPEDDRPATGAERQAAADFCRQHGFKNLLALIGGIGIPVGPGRDPGPRLFEPAASPEPPAGDGGGDTSFDPAEFEREGEE
jgi:hypothetical protein